MAESAVKDFSKKLKSSLSRLITPSSKCAFCQTVTGTDEIFCSQSCGLCYWTRYRKSHQVCGYPGCGKPCLVDANRTKVLDFCGQIHASQYKEFVKQVPSSAEIFQMTTGPIYFYNSNDSYYQFTNFYERPIVIDEKLWNSSEHYFQAQKFVGTPYVEVIRKLPRPREAFDLSRTPSISKWLRSDWESVKLDVMHKALLFKFSQHEDLRIILLQTGNRELVQHTWNDNYWGDGGDGMGQNNLGKLLMRVRKELTTSSVGTDGDDPTDKAGDQSNIRGNMDNDFCEVSGLSDVSTSDSTWNGDDSMLECDEAELSHYPEENFTDQDEATSKTAAPSVPPSVPSDDGCCEVVELSDVSNSDFSWKDDNSMLASSVCDEEQLSQYPLEDLIDVSDQDETTIRDGNDVLVPTDKKPTLSEVSTEGSSTEPMELKNGKHHQSTKTTLIQTPALPLMTQQQLKLPPRTTCSLPGCTKPKCVDPTTRKVYDYCGRMHALEHRRTQAELVLAHMKCRKPGCSMQKGPLPNRSGHYNYCLMQCSNSRGDIELGLTQLSSTSVQYTSIVVKFQNDWVTAKGPCPSVDHIFEVACKNLEKRWKCYKDGLATRGHPNTVEQYYHGTAIKCDLISSKCYCNHNDCGICGISKGGFQKSHIGSNITFMRFGRGFYLAPHSSKCHDYTRGTHTHRAMFLCDVLPGNKQIVQTDQIHLVVPPQGYDSVFGQPGGSLNYPELVIYDETSILPRYIIIYQKDGIAKIAK